MPPRITRNSYRPRASDRTMVDLESPLACCSRKLDGTANSPEGDLFEWLQVTLLQGSLIIVGWISRKPLASGRGRTFFLTSLLIELTDNTQCKIHDNGIGIRYFCSPHVNSTSTSPPSSTPQPRLSQHQHQQQRPKQRYYNVNNTQMFNI